MRGLDIKVKTNTVFFFDMDGTLVDTNLANFLAYKKALLSVTNSDFNLQFERGKRFNRRILRNTVQDLDESVFQRIIAKKEAYYKDFLFATRLNRVLLEVILKYQGTHSIVLVTNCGMERTLTTLNHFKLTEKFSMIFWRNSDAEEKWNKFSQAITALNVAPNSIIAFEDEEAEIINARNAGIQIINPIHLSYE